MNETAPVSIDTEKPVLMFSGQGSQKVGIGNDTRGVPSAREVFEAAADSFGFDVFRLISEGPQETLNETRYAQPAVVTLSLALYRILEEHGIEPAACLGFSLGQVSALYASGMLTLEQTFRFAKRRSEVMAEAAESTRGAMCALLGADEESADALCGECSQGEVLVPANYNCPGQIVISGTVEAIERAKTAWEAQRKRAVMLATSGAFHSPLMAEAAEELKAYLEQVEFVEPTVPLICNVDAKPLSAVEAPEHLAAHLTRPVRFMQSAQLLVDAGAKRFVEVGIGTVLVGLVKRIDKSIERTMIESAENAQSFIQERRL